MICQDQKIRLLKPVSLLRQIGDDDFMSRFVDRFYLCVMDDDLLWPYFVQTKTVRLKKELMDLFCQMLLEESLAPISFSEVSIDSSIELSRAHIDRIVFHLAAVLEWQNIPQYLIAQAVLAMAPRAGEILSVAVSHKAEI